MNMNFLTTVTGSYPRQQSQKDTLRKPSVSDEEALEMIKWASEEQANLGLDIITDGEMRRNNFIQSFYKKMKKKQLFL